MAPSPSPQKQTLRQVRVTDLARPAPLVLVCSYFSIFRNLASPANANPQTRHIEASQARKRPQVRHNTRYLWHRGLPHRGATPETGREVYPHMRPVLGSLVVVHERRTQLPLFSGPTWAPSVSRVGGRVVKVKHCWK